MNYFLFKIKKISLWRFLFAGFFLLGMSLELYMSMSFSGGYPSVQEMVLFRLDVITPLLLYSVFLILVADIGIDCKDNVIAKLRKSHFIRNLGLISFLCLAFIVSIILFNTFAMLLKGRVINLSNEWRALIFYGPKEILPSAAMGLSILFTFLRLVFIAVVVFAINSRCRKLPFGYMGGFAVCLLDAIAHFHLDIQGLGIFPFEHSSLEFALRGTNNLLLNILISVLYWIILIATVGLIYNYANKHKKIRKEDSLYDTSVY